MNARLLAIVVSALAAIALTSLTAPAPSRNWELVDIEIDNLFRPNIRAATYNSFTTPTCGIEK